jgi:hypothetical protein
MIHALLTVVFVWIIYALLMLAVIRLVDDIRDLKRWWRR